MKADVYYLVKSLFWRRKIGNRIEHLINGVDFSDALVNMKKEFRHSSPIEARRAAFNHYQSIIDVLYEGLNKEYKDDYQARIDLQYYLDSDNAVEVGNKNKFKLTDNFLNGIQIYMIVDKPLKGKKSKANNEYCIHGIRYIDYFDRLDYDLICTLESLFTEFKYYEKYNYPTDNEIVLKDFSTIGGEKEFYLQTPFDWDVLMNKYKGEELL